MKPKVLLLGDIHDICIVDNGTIINECGDDVLKMRSNLSKLLK